MITITGLDGQTYQPIDLSFSLEAPGERAVVLVAALPGSGPVQFAVNDDERHQRFLVEVPFPRSDEVSESRRLWLRIDEANRIRVEADAGTRLLILPARAPLPANYLSPVAAPAAIDMAILLDGTSRLLRSHRQEGADPATGWQAHIDQLAVLAAALVDGVARARFRVLAYGDHPLSDILADDLKSAYVLFPPDPDVRRHFTPFTVDALRKALSEVVGTSGGDFIDALGEALDECAFALHWDDATTTRRVLVISGESPGLTLLDDKAELPAGANGVAGRADIETPLAYLHQCRGVEVLAIYHGAPAQLKLDGSGPIATDIRSMLQYAERQFMEQLVCSPRLACTAVDFNPDELASHWRSLRIPMRRFAGPAIVTVNGASGRSG
ncbi:hypothetical protein [Candidatus Thiodictyon syntrophicum]|jgi:hypothetical protein|uniref:Uncharacterized protein n=1 Tax=Candidatus Thiodictyon syntrophicum TaxID=1166950 RepID=A0A2K8U6N9_9GAMM|nr:hypothetical protein [Candidatus Thiodictyon syntrophicum]AUB81224.1 hypothetical protein THSYN_09850 [Candidatus Thiodictyon syntrophicum]